MRALAGKELRLEMGIVAVLEFPVRLTDTFVLTALQFNLILLRTLKPKIP